MLCHLLISRLNGDGLIANETCIQTTGTTSVSICMPVCCFRRTFGKSVLGTKVLGNTVPERNSSSATVVCGDRGCVWTKARSSLVLPVCIFKDIVWTNCVLLEFNYTDLKNYPIWILPISSKYEY